MIAPSGPAYLLPTSIILLTFVTSSAINPGCQCVQYSSIPGDKEWGSFTSPDYPKSYPRGIRCLLFSFQAPKDHIVQIGFQLIKLPQPKNGCYGGDYMKLFLHLEDEGVNERTPWNSLICGEQRNQTFSSASKHLIIQFHSSPLSIDELNHARPHSALTTFGFHGHFRFINASQFESNGRLVPGTKCDYRFLSENFTSPEGKFFSPLHPSIYPHNTMCAYHFTAGLQERVKVVFESVILQPGKYSCLNKTDLIRIFDGPTSRSPVITVICNEAEDLEITSSGQDLYIEFIANSEIPGTGFRARYQFEKIVNQTDLVTEADAKQYYARQGLIRGEDGQPQASTLVNSLKDVTSIRVRQLLHISRRESVPQCNQVISSDRQKNGTLLTPNFPNPYPPKAHCRFEFIGHGRERVHIFFAIFDLVHSERINFNMPESDLKQVEEESEEGDGENGSNGSKKFSDFSGLFNLDYGRKGVGKRRRKGAIKDSDEVFKQLSREADRDSEKKCAYSDSVAAFVYMDGVERKLLRHCGENGPPNLMSNGNRMIVEFRARAITTAPSGRGFYAHYSFVENLGVTSGRQLENYPCAFIFKSSEMRNGTLSSPNYPGLYPRDTECHYFFHATKGDHVEIYFDKFEVLGISPCEEDWDDYVELSNHMPMEDPKYRRICGREPLRPFGVRSDGQFFRLSFKSNDRYDGFGFQARFQFTDKINQMTIVNVNSACSYVLLEISQAAAPVLTVVISYLFRRMVG